MDFDDAADELYGLPLDEFIATRNRLVKEAKKESPDDADRIRDLRKPTVAAWLANQLARHRRTDVRTLLELGEELRTATAAMDGSRLRDLTPRRHKAVDTLVKAARELSGKPVSQDVAQKLGETLDAALVDPAAAGALRSGRLTSALRHVGFGLVDESGEPSNVVSLATVRALREPARFKSESEPEEPEEPEEPAPAQKKPSAAERRRLREAEKAVAAAEKEADRIDAHAEQLAEDLEQRREQVKTAQAEVERLAAALEDARDAVAEARSEVRRVTDELEDSRQDARAARRRTREAQIELAKLTEL